MSPQMREELRELMDDLLRDDRLRIDMAAWPATSSQPVPTCHSASHTRSRGMSRWA